MLNDLVTGLIKAFSNPPCFRIYGKATYEPAWREIDVFATHRRDTTSHWPLWRSTCITWTDRVLAVGWDFARLIVREQSEWPVSREYPVTVAGGRLNDWAPRLRAGAGSQPTASEIVAHECGHTGQAHRWGAVYWPIGGAFTLFREGRHWWNRFENQASETGVFGGIVKGSIDTERLEVRTVH